MLTTRKDQEVVTKANGLSKVHKTLFQNGVEVITLPRRTVFVQLLQFLTSLEKKCILIAHNCRFDSSRLILAVKHLSLLQDYQEVIEGFSDTLLLFKEKYPKREGGYELTTLAAELLSLPCESAHDAKFDVILLEKLTVAFIDINRMMEVKVSVNDVIDMLENCDNIRKLVLSLVLIKGIISTAMQKRLSVCKISYDILIETYMTKGLEETMRLVEGKIDGIATIIKNKKILKAILDYLKTKI